jgi:hypothetical protein
MALSNINLSPSQQSYPFHSPNKTSCHDRRPPSNRIRQDPGNQSAKLGSSGRGCRDTRSDLGPLQLRVLLKRGPSGPWLRIPFVGVLSELSGHQGGVEAEEATTDDGYGHNDVDVSDDHFGG